MVEYQNQSWRAVVTMSLSKTIRPSLNSNSANNLKVQSD